MEQYFNALVVTKDTNDLSVRIGWCPEVVRLTNITEGKGLTWTRIMGNDSSLERVAAGDLTANTDKGIKLCQFTGPMKDMTADPTVIDPAEWYDANGITITADVAFLADDVVVLVEAWRSTNRRAVKGVHDGTTSSNTYFEDASYDFKKAGFKVGDIVYNQTNANYGFIKEITKPIDKAKFCRVYTATDRAGLNATAAADFDTSDVVFIIPIELEWYPLTDLTEMT